VSTNRNMADVVNEGSNAIRCQVFSWIRERVTSRINAIDGGWKNIPILKNVSDFSAEGATLCKNTNNAHIAKQNP